MAANGKTEQTNGRTGTPEATQGTMADFLSKEKAEAELANATEISNGGMTVAEFRVIDSTLMAEAISGTAELFQSSVCYNIPRKTSRGQISWAACKRMPNGYCKHENEKTKHIHNVDVGIEGARIAAQAYGGITYGALSMPSVIYMNEKPYWVVEVECYDEIRNLRVNHWQFQDLILDWGGTLTEIEHGAAIVQAKGLRKVILAVVPPQLRQIWVRNYLEGADEFDPMAVAALPGGREGTGSKKKGKALPPAEKEKKTPPKKETPPTNGANGKGKKTAPPTEGGMNLAKAASQLTTKLKATPVEIKEFCDSSFANVGQATVQFVRALSDTAAFNALKKKFDEWKAVKAEAEAEAEPEKQNGAEGK